MLHFKEKQCQNSNKRIAWRWGGEHARWGEYSFPSCRCSSFAHKCLLKKVITYLQAMRHSCPLTFAICCFHTPSFIPWARLVLHRQSWCGPAPWPPSKPPAVATTTAEGERHQKVSQGKCSTSPASALFSATAQTTWGKDPCWWCEHLSCPHHIADVCHCWKDGGEGWDVETPHLLSGGVWGSLVETLTSDSSFHEPAQHCLPTPSSKLKKSSWAPELPEQKHPPSHEGSVVQSRWWIWSLSWGWVSHLLSLWDPVQLHSPKHSLPPPSSLLPKVWWMPHKGAGGEVAHQSQEYIFNSGDRHFHEKKKRHSFRSILGEQFRNRNLSLGNANHLDCSNMFRALMLLKHCLYADCKAAVAWPLKDNFISSDLGK